MWRARLIATVKALWCFAQLPVIRRGRIFNYAILVAAEYADFLSSAHTARSSHLSALWSFSLIKCHWCCPPLLFTVKNPGLVEWKSFVLNSVRNIHKPITNRAGRSRSLRRRRLSVTGLSISAHIRSRTLTVRELLVI